MFEEPFEFRRLKFNVTDTSVMRNADYQRRLAQEIQAEGDTDFPDLGDLTDLPSIRPPESSDRRVPTSQLPSELIHDLSSDFSVLHVGNQGQGQGQGQGSSWPPVSHRRVSSHELYDVPTPIQRPAPGDDAPMDETE